MENKTVPKKINDLEFPKLGDRHKFIDLRLENLKKNKNKENHT